MSNNFPENTPTANPVFYRTYSRRTPEGRETWEQVVKRTLNGIKELGGLSESESALIEKMQTELKCLTSGRWLWVGGTDWVKNSNNFYGAYNCTGMNVTDWHSFGMLMDLAMMGCGTGAVLEEKYINSIPIIRNKISVKTQGQYGVIPASQRQPKTIITAIGQTVFISVGDSRQGWVESYQGLLSLSTDESFASNNIEVIVDLSHVRPAGETLKGFGGVSNPIKLEGLYGRCAEILNNAVGRQLNSVECCLLIDEAALVVVAGNVRRCLPVGALVFTDKGLVKIENIRVGDMVKTPIGLRKVTNVFDQGIQEVFETSTNTIPFYATLNHRVAVLNEDKELNADNFEWVEVRNLTEGDRLVPVTEVLPGIKTSLPASNKLKVPEFNETIAWMFGFTQSCWQGLAADSKMVKWNVFTGINFLPEVKEKLTVALKLFGATLATINESSAKTLFSSDSIALAQYLHFVINETPGEIPLFILQGLPSIRGAYLAGLIDGQNLNTLFPPLFSSKNEDFIKEIGVIFASLTIRVSYKFNYNARTGQSLYSLILEQNKEAFRDLVIPFCLRGKDIKGLPTEVTPRVETVVSTQMGGMVGSLKTANSKVFPGGAVVVVKNEDFRSLTVQTYDIEVEEAHCFYCDGYLTHNSAGLRQSDKSDELFADAKKNLWQEDNDGNWKIDPKRDALRMANHTRVFHSKPTLKEIREAVTSQYYSGEGAIQWAGEAIARANADILDTPEKKKTFIEQYSYSKWHGEIELVSNMGGARTREEIDHRLSRYSLNPCGEIIGSNFVCNLSEVHLNQFDPTDFEGIDNAFRAGALSVAALLHHEFTEPRFRYSRELDPIVGVSFTGLFDFFVNAFGVDWLQWWEAGRPENWDSPSMEARIKVRLAFISDKLLKLNRQINPEFEINDCAYDSDVFKMIEKQYLTLWREVVHQTVWDYCDRHGLKRPNRCTTLQPAGCGSREMLRVFDQGLIYADEILKDGSGVTENLNLSVRNGIKASSGIANEPLTLIKVTLSNGRILRLTPNHRLSIQDEWVRADELIKGMKIDFSLGEYQSTKETTFSDIVLDNYVKHNPDLAVGVYQKGYLTNITTPKEMSPDLGYLLGTLYGNGCMDERNGAKRIRFAHQDRKILGKIQSITKELFGIEGLITEDPRSPKKLELTIASKPLYDWFVVNDLAKTTKSKKIDRIPLNLRTSSRESILGFFCGLIDTDGCIRKEGSLSIDSSSEKFLRNLQQIGEAVGLCFSIGTNTKGQNFQKEKCMFFLTFSRMLSTEYARNFVNKNSIKALQHPIGEPKRTFKFNPYEVDKIEWEETPDYSFDFEVEGVNDDDSWYWAGALKSHNSKSLLTGASPGWHPPKAARFIRRITFAKNDPVALACLDCGYSVIPSQSDKDENGVLLDDPFDPRCTEWLVEIPVATSWANLPGADQIDTSKFSALAQIDFYMQVQQHYTTHNTSATWEIRESEIEDVSQRIHQAIQNDEGYISAAILSRFDDLQTYPRLPFEPIDKEKYEQMVEEVGKKRQTDDFHAALAKYDRGEMSEAGPAGCDSDKCMFPSK